MVKILERNGTKIILDVMREVSTVSIVFGFGTGSRHEDEKTNGISHFLEHMAFKGTKNRDYIQIAESVDNVGGVINAYTSKERTLYYVKLMKEDLELGIDILSDILQNSTFPEEEIEKERDVILQELASTLDTPDDVVFDHFYETAFSSSSLGRTILGPAENIKNISKQDFKSYLSKRYSRQNCVISICGNIDEEEVIKLIDIHFHSMQDAPVDSHEKAIYTGGGFKMHKENLEQVQCVVGFPSLSYLDEEIHTINVLSNILGGGMSSRLFQTIREKLGLVYTVSCWNDSYADTGIFAIYAGTSPSKVDKLLPALKEEIYKICDNITDAEMQRVIKQSQAGIIMSKESTNSRAKKACIDLLHLGRYMSYEEIMQKIAQITKHDICNAAKRMFSQKPTLTLYGNLANVQTQYEDFSQIDVR